MIKRIFNAYIDYLVYKDDYFLLFGSTILFATFLLLIISSLIATIFIFTPGEVIFLLFSGLFVAAANYVIKTIIKIKRELDA